MDDEEYIASHICHVWIVRHKNTSPLDYCVVKKSPKNENPVLVAAYNNMGEAVARAQKVLEEQALEDSDDSFANRTAGLI